jgi:hypothetical protein
VVNINENCDLTIFSTLTGFGYEFEFSPISKHGYKMGNKDISIRPELILRLILNLKNYFITHCGLSCYKNYNLNLKEQINYSINEIVK